MPCYSGQEESQRTVYRNGVDPQPYEYAIERLKDRQTWLEAAICALITELDTRNISSEVILEASKNGKIDIGKFWSEHKKDDSTRLIKDLEKYSQHELDIIKAILNK